MTSNGCPQCGAAHPPAALWCTLCFADLRAADLPATGKQVAPPVPNWPEPAVSAPGQPPVEPPVPNGGPTAVRPGWPCLRCGTEVDLDATDCPACGGGFLAPLADSGTVVVRVPGLGTVSTGTRRGRVALAGGLGMALLLAFVVIAFALGSII